MAMLLHLKGLPACATAGSIREFFKGYDIPYGGIVIPVEGNAFIQFSNNEDLLRAISKDGSHLLGSPISLLLSTEAEKNDVIEKSKQSLAEVKAPYLRRFEDATRYSSVQRGEYDHGGFADRKFKRDDLRLPASTFRDNDVYDYHQEPKRETYFYLKICNVDYGVTTKDIITFFGSLAESIPTDGVVLGKERNPPTAFVKFSDKEDYRVAQMMDGRRLLGKPVTVRTAYATDYELCKEQNQSRSITRHPYASYLNESGRTRSDIDRVNRSGQSIGQTQLVSASESSYPPQTAYGSQVAAMQHGFVNVRTTAREGDKVSSGRSDVVSSSVSIDYGHKSELNIANSVPYGYYVMLDQMPSWANVSWVKWFLSECKLQNELIYFVTYRSKALYSFICLASEYDVDKACSRNETKIGSDVLSVKAVSVEKVKTTLQNIPPHLSLQTSQAQSMPISMSSYSVGNKAAGKRNFPGSTDQNQYSVAKRGNFGTQNQPLELRKMETEGQQHMQDARGQLPVPGASGIRPLMGGRGQPALHGGRGQPQMFRGRWQPPMMGGRGHALKPGGRGQPPMLGGRGQPPMQDERGLSQMHGGRGQPPMLVGSRQSPMLGGRGQPPMPGGRGQPPMPVGRGQPPMPGGRGLQKMQGGRGQQKTQQNSNKGGPQQKQGVQHLKQGPTNQGKKQLQNVRGKGQGKQKVDPLANVPRPQPVLPHQLIRFPHERWMDNGDLFVKETEELVDVEGLPLGDNLTPEDVITWLSEAPRNYKVSQVYNVFKRPPLDISKYMVDIIELKMEIPSEKVLPKSNLIKGFLCRITHTSQYKACANCRKYGHHRTETSKCPAFAINDDCFFLEGHTEHVLNPSDMSCSIHYKGRKHLSLEHAFFWLQAKTLKRPDLAQAFLNAKDWNMFRDLWRQLHLYDALNWEVNNYKIWKDLCMIKYEKSASFRETLMGTGVKTIFFLHMRCPRGIGNRCIKKMGNIHPDYHTGLNLYGKALMEVRCEMRHKPLVAPSVVVLEDADDDSDSGKRPDADSSDLKTMDLGDDDDDDDVVIITEPCEDFSVTPCLDELIRVEGLPIGEKCSPHAVTDWLMSDPLNLEIIDGPDVTTRQYKGEFEISVVTVTVQGPVINPVLPEKVVIGGYTAKVRHHSQRRTRYCQFCRCGTHETNDKSCKAYQETEGKVHYFTSNKNYELSPNCSNTLVHYDGLDHGSVVHAYIWRQSQELAKLGIKGELSYTNGPLTIREPMVKSDRYKVQEWEAESFDLWKDLYRIKWNTSPAFRQALANTQDKEIMFIDTRLERGSGINLSSKRYAKVDPAWLPGMNLVGKALMAIRSENAGNPLMPPPTEETKESTKEENMDIAPSVGLQPEEKIEEVKKTEEKTRDKPLSGEHVGSMSQVAKEGRLLVSDSSCSNRYKAIDERKPSSGPDIWKSSVAVENSAPEPVPTPQVEESTPANENKKVYKSPDTYEMPEFIDLNPGECDEVLEIEGLPLSPDFPPEIAIAWLRESPKCPTVIGHYNVIKRAPSDISDYEVYVIQVKVRGPINPVFSKSVFINGCVCKMIHPSQSEGNVCIACREHGHTRQDTEQCPAFTDNFGVHFVENIESIELSPTCTNGPVEYEGFTHASVNHAFLWKEAMALGRSDLAEKIRETVKSSQIRDIWTKLHFYEALNWEMKNFQLYKELFRLRWQNSGKFRTQLRATGNKSIMYIHIRISRGIGVTGLKRVQLIKPEYYPGYNMVGRALMEVRTEMRNWTNKPMKPILPIIIQDETEEERDASTEVVDMDIE